MLKKLTRKLKVLNFTFKTVPVRSMTLCDTLTHIFIRVCSLGLGLYHSNEKGSLPGVGEEEE